MFSGLFSRCFNCEKLRTVIADRDAEINHERASRRELEARLQVVRAEMHDLRNEANSLSLKLATMEAQNKAK